MSGRSDEAADEKAHTHTRIVVCLSACPRPESVGHCLQIFRLGVPPLTECRAHRGQDGSPGPLALALGGLPRSKGHREWGRRFPCAQPPPLLAFLLPRGKFGLTRIWEQPRRHRPGCTNTHPCAPRQRDALQGKQR